MGLIDSDDDSEDASKDNEAHNLSGTQNNIGSGIPSTSQSAPREDGQDG